MNNFATGGYIEGDPEPILIYGCDYLIPREFADRWKEVLDRLNEDGVE